MIDPRVEPVKRQSGATRTAWARASCMAAFARGYPWLVRIRLRKTIRTGQRPLRGTRSADGIIPVAPPALWLTDQSL